MVYSNYPTGNLKRMANVQLLYNNSKVQKQCTDLKTAKKLFGGNAALATSLFARINAMQQASVIKDIVMMPTFYFHKLNGNMDGFFAIASYLTNHPLRIKTFDDTIIEGFEIYKGPSDETLSYDKNQIIGVDWDEYNTDVKVEFIKKGTKIAKGKKSIQDTLREILLSDPKNKYVLYDHGTGEMADYITIQEETNQWIVKLYHVKKKSATGYNNSMNDVYEVAGQAVKSIIWLSSTAKLIDKIRSRQQSSHCVPIRGDSKALLKELRSATKQLAGYIVIVQPGLSKSTNMNIKVQEVLASAASYISRAGRVKGLEVIGSK